MLGIKTFVGKTTNPFFHGQGTQRQNSADSLAKNKPNAAQFVCQRPKFWDIIEKRLHRVSVGRGSIYDK